jgi:hypothetical protein
MQQMLADARPPERLNAPQATLDAQPGRSVLNLLRNVTLRRFRLFKLPHREHLS